MPARLQLNPLLRKCVPGCHHETGIVLDPADGPTILQVVEALNLPAEEPSNITSRVDSSPGKPKRVAANTGCLILAKMIGGG